MDDVSKKPFPVQVFKKIKAPPGARWLKFVQLGPNMCQYELGQIDKPAHKYRFCGLPTHKGRYCDYHHNIIKSPALPKPIRRLPRWA